MLIESTNPRSTSICTEMCLRVVTMLKEECLTEMVLDGEGKVCFLNGSKKIENLNLSRRQLELQHNLQRAFWVLGLTHVRIMS